MFNLSRYLLILLLPFALVCAYGQQTEAKSRPTTAPMVLAEDVQGLISDINKAYKDTQKTLESTPDDAALSATLEQLLQAREQVKHYDRYTSATTEFENETREARSKLETVQTHIQQDVTSGATETETLPSTATLEQVNQWLEMRKAEMANYEEMLAHIPVNQEKRNQRLAAIPREVADSQRQQSNAEFVIQATQEDVQLPQNKARWLLARIQYQAADAQLRSLAAEQEMYNALGELYPPSIQVLSDVISSLREIITSETERLDQLKTRQASDTARELKERARQADTSHTLLRQAAAKNTSVTEHLSYAQVLEDQRDLLRTLDTVNKLTSRTIEQDTNLRAKFQAVGNSDAVGILLRKQRNDLPNRRFYREAIARQETLLTDVNLKTFEIRDELSSVADPGATARQLVAQQNMDAGSTETQEVRRNLTDLLQQRKDFLSQARDAYDNYFQTLVDLNAAENELLRATTSFSDFIDERILWLPSAERLSVSAFSQAADYIYSLVHPGFWRSYFQYYQSALSRSPVLALLCAALLIVIIGSRSYWKKRLAAVLHSAAKNRLEAFSPVIKAMAFAVCFVAPLPLLLIFAGLPLRQRFDIPIEYASIASGIVSAGFSLFFLQLTRVFIRKNGITETFFVWPEKNLHRLRHVLTFICWVFPPMILLLTVSLVTDSTASMEAARIALLLGTLVFGGVVVRLLWPPESILAGTEVYHEKTWLYRLRYPLFISAMFVPLLMLVSLFMGYTYTSIEIIQRLNDSIALAALFLFINEIVFFWILVKRRRLAIEEARRRREALKAQKDDSSGATSGDMPAVSSEPALDIAAISQQAGRLLHVFVLGAFCIFMWAVWVGMLPALRYLDAQPLWETSRPVTIVSLLLAVLVGMVAVIALRNIPGLLDITLFQRYSVGKGERYAFNTIIQYIIIIAGCISIFYQLGLEWSHIQWLAAGVSVGLGFGLQEIFANFVSGLILLFERPVRVGDVVTVGEVSGRVTQIRIRATTIVTADHKEYLIPNKDLITKQVLNWTLSDKMVRLLIKVGVNYGADYEKVREVLLRIARDNPHTLDDPAPAAAIEDLRPSAVEFSLSVHLPNMDNMGDVRHDMMARIDQEFRLAGISIPYPTMDIRMERAATQD